jgi:Transposase
MGAVGATPFSPVKTRFSEPRGNRRHQLPLRVSFYFPEPSLRQLIVSRGIRVIPAAKSPEFRRRAVELARLQKKPVAQIARDLQINESLLRRWMDRADVDDSHKPA